MRRPQFNMKMFKERRATLAAKAGAGSVFVFPSHPDMIRNNDVHHTYRPDSNMFYLTGWEEPESVFVFRPGQTPESILFVRKKDTFRETWDGFRYGPEAAMTEFSMDKSYLVDEFDNTLPDLLKGAEKIYYRWNLDASFDQRMLKILEDLRTRARGQFNPAVHDSLELVGEMRLHKTDAELQLMRKACDITSEAHLEVMKAIRPGMNERHIHGMFIAESYKRGASREGYGTIVAGGANATTLHYVFNDQPLKDGDLLLIDAGAEAEYYTGDITRTYPVNGKFTPVQRKVYEKVLDVNKAIIKMIKPGLAFSKLQETTIEMLVDVMLEFKLLSGDKKKIIETLEYKKYYPHGVGHWLGLDVHDAGSYTVKGETRPIAEGMCFTVEPGLYIPENDTTAPAELRGIGIRIEDNIFVTSSGTENMTAKCVKEVDELEAIIGR